MTTFIRSTNSGKIGFVTNSIKVAQFTILNAFDMDQKEGWRREGEVLEINETRIKLTLTFNKLWLQDGVE